MTMPCIKMLLFVVCKVSNVLRGHMAVITSLSPGSHGGPAGDTWQNPQGKGMHGVNRGRALVLGPRGGPAGDTWHNREEGGGCGDIRGLESLGVPHGSGAGDWRVCSEWPSLGDKVCGTSRSNQSPSPCGEEELGFQPLWTLPPAASRSVDRFLCHFWKREAKSENIRGDLRSFTHVVRSRPAPIVMVGGRGRGWGKRWIRGWTPWSGC